MIDFSFVFSFLMNNQRNKTVHFTTIKDHFKENNIELFPTF